MVQCILQKVVERSCKTSHLHRCILPKVRAMRLLSTSPRFFACQRNLDIVYTLNPAPLARLLTSIQKPQGILDIASLALPPLVGITTRYAPPINSVFRVLGASRHYPTRASAVLASSCPAAARTFSAPFAQVTRQVFYFSSSSTSGASTRPMTSGHHSSRCLARQAFSRTSTFWTQSGLLHFLFKYYLCSAIGAVCLFEITGNLEVSTTLWADNRN